MLNRLIAGTLALGIAGAGVLSAGQDRSAQAAPSLLMGVHDSVAPGQLAKRYPGVRATREFVAGVQGPGVDLRTKYEVAAKPSWAATSSGTTSLRTTWPVPSSRRRSSASGT